MNPTLNTAPADECRSHQLLKRIKPAPVPPIHPVPEIKARGELLKTYEDTKQVLQVPWMGVVTMAFAHYPHFYSALWRGLRPLCASRQFEDACRELRAKVERNLHKIACRPLESDLLSAGYAPIELDQIRGLIEIFSRGNMPYLLLATIARLLLEDQPLSTRRLVDPYAQDRPAEQAAPLVLMEPHHGNESLQSLYQEIKATLGLPFVNTDYRALARWPGYFALAWNDLRPQIQSTDYEPMITEIHNTAVELALDLPNPGLLSPARLQAAAEEDRALDEIRDVVRLFQYLLPGLVANIAFFRAQLLPEASLATESSQGSEGTLLRTLAFDGY